MTRVSVENEKYTFISEEGTVRVLRYGEEWFRVDRCSKAIIAMMYELKEARELVKEIWSLAKGAKRCGEKFPCNCDRCQELSQRIDRLIS